MSFPTGGPIRKLLREREICQDILRKLRETGQIYIVEHDYPISVSKDIFRMLEAVRREMAKRKGIPEVQYEFEDLFLYYIVETKLSQEGR